MFVPRPYREPDGSWMVDLIRSNPLALMSINGAPGEAPYATHLPVIPDPEATGECGPNLVGARLLGHMNKANPHWKALATGGTVLITFTGPHAYVSPTVYDVSPAAPTWNFTSVHVRGVAEKIVGTEATLAVVKATVAAFEQGFGTGWDMGGSIDYFRRILPGVGAFRVLVDRADGMFKLSQEQPDEVRERVQESFAQRACTRHQQVAGMMSQLPG